MRTPKRVERFWDTDWSLRVLLGLQVIFIFFLHPLGAMGYRVEGLGSGAFAAMLLSGIVAVARSRAQALLFAAVALTAVTIHWARLAIFGDRWIAPDAVASFTACAMLAMIVLARVFRAGPITISRIEGAVAAYLLIAIMFASVFTTIDVYSAGAAFNGMQTGVDANPMPRAVYFSFVTLTTLGYGDIVPVAPFARSMAILEALIGQIFPAVLLARLVSLELYYRTTPADTAPS